MENLVDKYVFEVGQRLPKKNRADIEAEIRSLIQDTLESRSQSTGRPVDETLAVEVLKEFGPPEKMAEAYQPTRYLIGPRLFPSFILVMRIILTVLLVVAAVRVGVTLGTAGINWQSTGDTVLTIVLNMFQSAFSLLGSVVLIFALLEWFLIKKFKVQELETWDPNKLKGEKQEDRVEPVGQVVGIVFTILVIVLLNFFPNMIGISFNGSQWIQGPVLNDVFFRYLPFINVILGLSIVKDLVLLRQGNHTKFTRWFAIGLSLCNIILASIILKGPSILDQSAILKMVNVPVFFQIVNVAVHIVLILVIIGESWNIALMIYRMFIKKAPVFVVEGK